MCIGCHAWSVSLFHLLAYYAPFLFIYCECWLIYHDAELWRKVECKLDPVAQSKDNQSSVIRYALCNVISRWLVPMLIPNCQYWNVMYQINDVYARITMIILLLPKLNVTGSHGWSRCYIGTVIDCVRFVSLSTNQSAIGLLFLPPVSMLQSQEVPYQAPIFIFVDDSNPAIHYNRAWSVANESAVQSDNLADGLPMLNTLHVLHAVSGSFSYDFTGEPC